MQIDPRSLWASITATYPGTLEGSPAGSIQEAILREILHLVKETFTIDSRLTGASVRLFVEARDAGGNRYWEPICFCDASCEAIARIDPDQLPQEQLLSPLTNVWWNPRSTFSQP